ncbi:sigma-70 family RNA polymerase sigma factor [Eubacterium sp. An3]|uniref:RNA polymerase sigma factor n=1 Tax=Eubacterium sp. An3 TaxID=1965628 RepID=UPI001FA91D09|nr:sigma-70 family RNA polymerase sigma factor [Eubacterium sp. An3]
MNLRDLYPDVYKTDAFVDVAEEVLAVIQSQQQADAAYERQKFRHKAHYSLDREDDIENDTLARPLTPEEVMEQKQLREEVYAALMQLPAIQARRIYARFYLGMTVAEIAKVEGVDRRRVWASIRRGLKKLAYLLDANK